MVDVVLTDAAGVVLARRLDRDGDVWRWRREADGATFSARDGADAARALQLVRTPARPRPTVDWPLVDHLDGPLVFTLEGAPRTKNTGKVSRATGRVYPPAPYRRWLRGVLAQMPAIRAALGFRGCLTCPVRVEATWHLDAARRVDQDRLQVALGDALKARGGAGIVLDDDHDRLRWGDSRVLVDRDRPRIDVCIQEDRP